MCPLENLIPSPPLACNVVAGSKLGHLYVAGDRQLETSININTGVCFPRRDQSLWFCLLLCTVVSSPKQNNARLSRWCKFTGNNLSYSPIDFLLFFIWRVQNLNLRLLLFTISLRSAGWIIFLSCWYSLDFGVSAGFLFGFTTATALVWTRYAYNLWTTTSHQQRLKILTALVMSSYSKHFK